MLDARIASGVIQCQIGELKCALWSFSNAICITGANGINVVELCPDELSAKLKVCAHSLEQRFSIDKSAQVDQRKMFSRPVLFLSEVEYYQSKACYVMSCWSPLVKVSEKSGGRRPVGCLLATLDTHHFALVWEVSLHPRGEMNFVCNLHDFLAQKNSEMAYTCIAWSESTFEGLSYIILGSKNGTIDLITYDKEFRSANFLTACSGWVLQAKWSKWWTSKKQSAKGQSAKEQSAMLFVSDSLGTIKIYLLNENHALEEIFAEIRSDYLQTTDMCFAYEHENFAYEHEKPAFAVISRGLEVVLIHLSSNTCQVIKFSSPIVSLSCTGTLVTCYLSNGIEEEVLLSENYSPENWRENLRENSNNSDQPDSVQDPPQKDFQKIFGTSIPRLVKGVVAGVRSAGVRFVLPEEYAQESVILEKVIVHPVCKLYLLALRFKVKTFTLNSTELIYVLMDICALEKDINHQSALEESAKDTPWRTIENCTQKVRNLVPNLLEKTISSLKSHPYATPEFSAWYLAHVLRIEGLIGVLKLQDVSGNISSNSNMSNISNIKSNTKSNTSNNIFNMTNIKSPNPLNSTSSMFEEVVFKLLKLGLDKEVRFLQAAVYISSVMYELNKCEKNAMLLRDMKSKLLVIKGARLREMRYTCPVCGKKFSALKSVLPTEDQQEVNSASLQGNTSNCCVDNNCNADNTFNADNNIYGDKIYTMNDSRVCCGKHYWNTCIISRNLINTTRSQVKTCKTCREFYSLDYCSLCVLCGSILSAT